MKPPYLLVVSARNSRDPGLARSCSKPSGRRCGGGGAIGEEIAPQPPTQVSFDTARSNRHKTLKMLMRGGGPNCQRKSEEQCLVAKWLGVTNLGTAAMGHKSCGRLGATTLTRSYGET